MKIAIAGDSAGRALAKALVEHLADQHDVDDLCDRSDGAQEYYAHLSDRVGNAVMRGEYERAILICGTGIGVQIAANKVPGIRAAQCHDTYSAQRAALSNDAQVITMGARVIGPELAKSICDAYLEQSFDQNGRSVHNVKAINEVDQKYR